MNRERFEDSRPLLDRITDAFFAVDDRWRFTYLNDRAEEMLDRSRDQLLGRVIWDEFPETVETQFPDSFYQAMERQEPVSFEVYHTPLETWFEANAFPSDDGLTVYMQDVTDDKRRKKDLARYESIVEAAHDGIIAIDAQNRVAFVNAALEDAAGIDRSAVVGEHLEALIERIEVPSDRLGRVGHALDTLRSGDADLRQIELPHTGPNDEQRHAEVRFVPLDDGTASVAGIVRDITDRHEYERVVTSLHDVTRELFAVHDRVEICSIVVHAASQLLDMPISGVWLLDDELGKLDPVAGSAGAYDELGGLPQFNEGEGLVWKVFERNEPTIFDDVHEEEDRYNPDTPIRSQIIVPLGAKGIVMTGALEPGAFDETDLDLLSTLGANAEAALERTDRDRLLRERKRVLERQSERLDAVSAVIRRHTKARLGAAFAHLDDESPAAKRVAQADSLLDDVLEFAHGRASVGPRSEVRLTTTVSEAVEQCPSPLEVRIEADATLRADRERFGRFFTALFDAIADADRETVVDVHLLDGRHRGFDLVVRGSRLPDDPTDEVFEVGYEVSEDSAGLGLAVAREIADAHGWSIGIDESHDDGVRIVVDGITTLEAIA
ncbi:MAG: PAS domain-containing protein [Halanaeroarchaeum sp.]